MLSERLLTSVIQETTKHCLRLSPTSATRMPEPKPDQPYMLYMHVPFCERLCPYCSFNRFPMQEDKARRYFKNMRDEMLMLRNLGYDFESVYIGGGTPTILIDELCETIDLARDTFPGIKEVSSETNPNHLTREYLEKLHGRVQRLSVGVQSFDDGLLKQMDRFEKYGSGQEILERIGQAVPYFTSLNADMIFNFPAQTEDILISDIERVIESGATQTTFYPLMASPSVQRSMAATVGKVDYSREGRFYETICELLTGKIPGIDLGIGKHGEEGLFEFGSAWTFNRKTTECAESAKMKRLQCEDDSRSSVPGVSGASDLRESAPECTGYTKMKRLERKDDVSETPGAMIDEYVVDYEEYPAIGSGGITYLGNTLFVNTFSINDYNNAVESGRMSMMGSTQFSLRDRMRYRFMMQLFGLHLDKQQFKRDFGMSIEAGLPVEMAFMRACGAFATDNEYELTLTQKGRYLTVVMMRQFFIGVNNLRDQARAALTGEERELIFGSGICTNSATPASAGASA